MKTRIRSISGWNNKIFQKHCQFWNSIYTSLLQTDAYTNTTIGNRDLVSLVKIFFCAVTKLGFAIVVLVGRVIE